MSRVIPFDRKEDGVVKNAGFFRRGSGMFSKGSMTMLEGVEVHGRIGRCCRFIFRRNKGGVSEKSDWSSFRVYVNEIVNATWFSNFILGIIFLNSVLITLQNIDATMLVASYYFDVFDKILMGIYILELGLKIYAQQERFGDSGWNVFDAFIVSISIIETAMYTFLNDSTSLSPSIFRLFRVFKALRAMRALRAISFLSNLQVIISTLFRSIPAMGSIILLLVLLLYIFAIIFVTLYRDLIHLQFGNLWLAMFSLFQLITLDDWSTYYQTVYDMDPSRAPQFMVYMSIFIVLETFICINLFIAVIVNNLERATERERLRRKKRQEQQDTQRKMEMVLAEEEEANKRRKRHKRRGGVGDDDARSVRSRRKKPSNDTATEYDQESEYSEESYASTLLEGGGDDSERNVNKPEQFLNDPSIPIWQRELQPVILALLASLDYNTDILHQHQQVLDDLVDVSKPKRVFGTAESK